MTRLRRHLARAVLVAAVTLIASSSLESAAAPVRVVESSPDTLRPPQPDGGPQRADRYPMALVEPVRPGAVPMPRVRPVRPGPVPLPLQGQVLDHAD